MSRIPTQHYAIHANVWYLSIAFYKILTEIVDEYSSNFPLPRRANTYANDEIKKPRALQILGYLLTQCDPEMPEVQIDQRQLGQKLGIHQETAGRWVRYLETTGKLAFLGYCEHGRKKRCRLFIGNTKPEGSTHKLLNLIAPIGVDCAYQLIDGYFYFSFYYLAPQKK